MLLLIILFPEAVLEDVEARQEKCRKQGTVAYTVQLSLELLLDAHQARNLRPTVLYRRLVGEEGRLADTGAVVRPLEELDPLVNLRKVHLLVESLREDPEEGVGDLWVIVVFISDAPSTNLLCGQL